MWQVCLGHQPCARWLVDISVNNPEIGEDWPDVFELICMDPRYDNEQDLDPRISGRGHDDRQGPRLWT